MSRSGSLSFSLLLYECSLSASAWPSPFSIWLSHSGTHMSLAPSCQLCTFLISPTRHCWHTPRASLSLSLWRLHFTSQTPKIFQPYLSSGLFPVGAWPKFPATGLMFCFYPKLLLEVFPTLSSSQAVNDQHTPGWFHQSPQLYLFHCFVLLIFSISSNWLIYSLPKTPCTFPLGVSSPAVSAVMTGFQPPYWNIPSQPVTSQFLPQAFFCLWNSPSKDWLPYSKHQVFFSFETKNDSFSYLKLFLKYFIVISFFYLLGYLNFQLECTVLEDRSYA